MTTPRSSWPSLFSLAMCTRGWTVYTAAEQHRKLIKGLKALWARPTKRKINKPAPPCLPDDKADMTRTNISGIKNLEGMCASGYFTWTGQRHTNIQVLTPGITTLLVVKFSLLTVSGVFVITHHHLFPLPLSPSTSHPPSFSTNKETNRLDNNGSGWKKKLRRPVAFHNEWSRWPNAFTKWVGLQSKRFMVPIRVVSGSMLMGS